MTTLDSQVVNIAEFCDGISRLMKQRDATNVRIISAMQRLGPRNLLEVSRRTRIPFTSVYNRVRKLEPNGRRIVHLLPALSKCGLVSMTVLTKAKAGSEDKVTQALKVLGYWRSIARCEGDFTHHSTHQVPPSLTKQYRQYLKEISRRGLGDSNTTIVTGDFQPNATNFSYYDTGKREWKFPWHIWLRGLTKQRVSKVIDDPNSYDVRLDRRDLVMLKEFEKDGRATFADLSKILGITLQAVKYRYDKKLRVQGIVRNFWIDFTPYPPELSALYEIFVQFPSGVAMNRLYSYLPELFFVIGLTKVVKSDAFILRVYIPESQITNLYRFLSELCKRKALLSYSAIRLRSDTEQRRTIPEEMFNDQNGWMFDYKKNISKLKALV